VPGIAGFGWNVAQRYCRGPREPAGQPDLFAGFAAGIMTVAYGLSFAALIFSASLHTWLARYRGHLYHHGHRRIVCGGKELSPLCHSRS
jgi:hypothetical protein